MSDPVANNVLVETLASTLKHGGSALSSVPMLLKEVLRDESWREFQTRRGQLVQHQRFVDFVTAEPLAGLGADLALVRRVVTDDPETLDLLDRATILPAHRPGITNDNIMTSSDQGTSRTYALRRLRKDRPDLHQRVIEKEISPHAAMVLAGLRPKTMTVRASVEGFTKAIKAQLSEEEIGRLKEML